MKWLTRIIAYLRWFLGKSNTEYDDLPEAKLEIEQLAKEGLKKVRDGNSGTAEEIEELNDELDIVKSSYVKKGTAVESFDVSNYQISIDATDVENGYYWQDIVSANQLCFVFYKIENNRCYIYYAGNNSEQFCYGSLALSSEHTYSGVLSRRATMIPGSGNNTFLNYNMGSYSWKNVTQLPSVTASDNGKTMQVVNGAWQKKLNMAIIYIDLELTNNGEFDSMQTAGAVQATSPTEFANYLLANKELPIFLLVNVFGGGYGLFTGVPTIVYTDNNSDKQLDTINFSLNAIILNHNIEPETGLYLGLHLEQNNTTNQWVADVYWIEI